MRHRLTAIAATGLLAAVLTACAAGGGASPAPTLEPSPAKPEMMGTPAGSMQNEGTMTPEGGMAKDETMMPRDNMAKDGAMAPDDGTSGSNSMTPESGDAMAPGESMTPGAIGVGESVTPDGMTTPDGSMTPDAMTSGESMPSKESMTPGDAMAPGDTMSPEGAMASDGVSDGMMEAGAAGSGSSMQEHDSMTPSDAMIPGGTMGAGDVMEQEGSMDESMGENMGEDAMGTSMEMAGPDGRYVTYSSSALSAATERGRAVLFFKADWCPTCRTADADFKANLAAIPEDVTVLQVNYDTEDELKQRYQITYQHTFVQVDASGNEITRWSGGGTDRLLGTLK